ADGIIICVMLKRIIVTISASAGYATKRSRPFSRPSKRGTDIAKATTAEKESTDIQRHGNWSFCRNGSASQTNSLGRDRKKNAKAVVHTDAVTIFRASDVFSLPVQTR